MWKVVSTTARWLLFVGDLEVVEWSDATELGVPTDRAGDARTGEPIGDKCTSGRSGLLCPTRIRRCALGGVEGGVRIGTSPSWLPRSCTPGRSSGVARTSGDLCSGEPSTRCGVPRGPRATSSGQAAVPSLQFTAAFFFRRQQSW